MKIYGEIRTADFFLRRYSSSLFQWWSFCSKRY